MTNSDREIPKRLSNRYEILDILSDGGFGKTFLVEDTQMPSGRKCVLKQLKPVDDNPQIHQMVQERFQREAAILERLGENHSQIPRLYAYFSEGDQFYLVEEWIEGDTLTQKVHKQGTFSEATVRSLLINLLPAIADIHQQQIVHRDIKPDNIILRKSDFKPVLIDFGAVKETMGATVNTQGNSTHSMVVGTPGYMPSEQLAGRPVFATDLYSLGLTAIYLLTGKQPQQLDTDPRSGIILWQIHAPNVSPEIAALLNKAIHMNVSQRFATAQDMLTALNSGAVEFTTSPVAPTYPQSTPTVMSAPQYPSGANTQVSFPQGLPSQPLPNQPVATGGEWKKAVLLGGIIGASILGGALMLKSSIPGFSSASTSQTAKSELSSSPSPSPSVQPSASGSSPSPSPISSQPSPPPSPVSTVPPVPPSAATPPSTPAPSVAPSFQSSQIPQRSQTVNSNSDATNATIIGEAGSKNIRSGPGTKFASQHIAYPGDRVRILSSSQDEGGYTWYKVYFPKSGADGWIAAQLINTD